MAIGTIEWIIIISIIGFILWLIIIKVRNKNSGKNKEPYKTESKESIDTEKFVIKNKERNQKIGFVLNVMKMFLKISFLIMNVFRVIMLKFVRNVMIKWNLLFVINVR